jgi:hypothetical protein
MVDSKESSISLPFIVSNYSDALSITTDKTKSIILAVSAHDFLRILKLVDESNIKRIHKRLAYHEAMPHAIQRKPKTEPIKMIAMQRIEKCNT